MATVQSPSRELCRSADFTPAHKDEPDDGRTLVGYGATFGSPTEIRSWEGHFNESIRKGAFRKSLSERTPVLQFDHGQHPLIGSIPIGSITDIREDDHGLYIEARISDNWLMQPVRDAISEGSVGGMSFRFEVIREEWRTAEGELLRDPDEIMRRLYMPDPEDGPLQRTLTEVRMREVGPVVFPAYESTTVGVRARSVADEFTSSPDLAAKVRSALALDASGGEGDLDNPDFRKEVAHALLFQRMAPVTADHPVSEETPAPVADETPVAPVVDDHPTPDPMTLRLRGQIAEITRKMADVNASINDKELS